MSELVLPTVPTINIDQSPTNLVIFSKPKTGKTSLLAGLPRCLILDFEKGSKYVKALRINVESIDQLAEIGNAIVEANYPYDFVAIDTITALEDMCVGYAEVLYSRSPMGKRWFEAETGGKAKYGNILALPDGAGYNWLRQAFTKVVSMIEQFAPRIILSGHIKDIFLGKDDTKFSAAELDLTGALKRIVASKSDSIGYLFRKKNQTILSFKTTDDVICGARPEHISNQDIVVSEKIGEKLYTYWDKIFLDLDPQERAPEEDKKK